MNERSKQVMQELGDEIMSLDFEGSLRLIDDGERLQLTLGIEDAAALDRILLEASES